MHRHVHGANLTLQCHEVYIHSFSPAKSPPSPLVRMRFALFPVQCPMHRVKCSIEIYERTTWMSDQCAHHTLAAAGENTADFLWMCCEIERTVSSLARSLTLFYVIMRIHRIYLLPCMIQRTLNQSGSADSIWRHANCILIPSCFIIEEALYIGYMCVLLSTDGVVFVNWSNRLQLSELMQVVACVCVCAWPVTYIAMEGRLV